MTVECLLPRFVDTYRRFGEKESYTVSHLRRQQSVSKVIGYRDGRFAAVPCLTRVDSHVQQIDVKVSECTEM